MTKDTGKDQENGSVLSKEIPKISRQQFNQLNGILVLSAWGLAMVVSSFLFLYLGYLVDEILGTTPNFMLSSFMLAIGICIWRLYKEAKKRGIGL
ncbi:MAG: putative F0F1-ATPase subunit Ca2+/Mg2+ transporter [Deltaproteobacteria bacterium]|jgi:F0F1-type ATP synthase assembly protein I|nr:putative F0F1-ATPase subunit Ca2+/Mg2+ transporter [Deltaproteobacteria bacterium]